MTTVRKLIVIAEFTKPVDLEYAIQSLYEAIADSDFAVTGEAGELILTFDEEDGHEPRCAQCGEAYEDDPDGSEGVLVHDRSLGDAAFELDRDHTPVPENAFQPIIGSPPPEGGPDDHGIPGR